MRTILSVFLLAAASLQADDRADIDHLVASLSEAKSGAAVRALCSPDTDAAEIAHFASIHTGAVTSADRVWSEVMPPRLVVASVRFVTHDVALVDAFDRQVGSINTRSVPWLLVLRRGPDGWKLASLRVVSNVAQSDRFRQPF